jgi:hypothetical protein
MITITNIPQQVETEQNFVIEGTASNDLIGQPIELIIDNQFKVSGGKVGDDGSWEINFVFLSPGDRRLKVIVGDPTDNTDYANITVVPDVPSLSITHFPDKIETSKPFVIKGKADNFEDGEELLIRIDGRFDVAKPIVEGGTWDAQIVLSQGGTRLLEVIASDQEKIQRTIEVETDGLKIIPRQVWGAPPTPSSLPNLNAKRITIHHTANPTLSPNASEATEFKRMKMIRDFQVNQLKWSDIAYHYVIMPSGRVYEGRYDKKRGAHDTINDGFGIAFEGSYHKPGSMITEAQFKSAVALCTQLCKRIGISDPTTRVSTPTYFSGQPNKQLPRILGHRDRGQTSCPGMPEETLEKIRQGVKSALS